jgi:hypothetical protein
MRMRWLVTSSALALAVNVAAQQATPASTPAPNPRIIAAETAARSFPFLSRTAPVRQCTIVKPAQIVFPATTGDPASYNLFSGEFTAGSISFGWDKTYEQAKMPLWPRHANNIGTGLQLVLTSLDSNDQIVQSYQPLSNNAFATWPKFPSPGRWMIVATAGVNWGCFVLDRPVRTLGPLDPWTQDPRTLGP